MIEKKICLQKRICHKLAPSNDFTIIPPKLKHNAPRKIRSEPGILFNNVNLALLYFLLFLKYSLCALYTIAQLQTTQLA